MTPRTQTRPLDDPLMWRLALAATHPDTDRGSHELFIWCGMIKDAVCGGGLQVQPKRPETRTPPTQPPPDDRPRIPYPVGTDFGEATRRALLVEGPYAVLLSLLSDCYPLPRLAHEQDRGAGYKRLAAIAYAHDMSQKERSGWYRCAESIPLSDRHASHILSKQKRRAA